MTWYASYRLQLLFNPLTPLSDKHLISPDNITAESHIIVIRTRRSKIVSRATGRRAVTSVDHSWCAVVLKEIQRYHGSGLWAWRKIFSPLRGTNSTTTHCHIFLVQYPDRYYRGCCCGPFEAGQPKRY